MNRHPHSNEKGIAIIIVIAIMVALMMLVTALLGTVTRMGDTAKSYKYDSLLRLGCLSGRADAMAHLDDKKKDLTEAREWTDSAAYFQFYDKDFKYVGAVETGDSFFAVRPSFYVLDLGSCLSLTALADSTEREKKVYTDMTNNVKEAGAENEIVKVLGVDKKISDLIADYKLEDVLTDDTRFYTFNDVGARVNKDDIFESSMLFSPYGATAAPLEYDLKIAPQWLIASMIGNYHNYQYQVDGAGAGVVLDASKLKKIYDKIVEVRGSMTTDQVREEIFKLDIYNGAAECDDPAAKTNAAIEKLVYSMMGGDTKKYVVKAGEPYAPNSFTGRLVDDSDALSRYYRVIVRTEVENLASGEILGTRYYEFVYDKKNGAIVSSRWFELE